MNHTADDGFHEIQLSGKQLVFLFMATTVVAVVIFLCGVQVGRGVRTEHTTEAADAGSGVPVAAVQTPSPAPPSQPAASASASGPPAAEPPAPAPEGDEDLSYANRLQSDKPQADKLKPGDQASHAPVNARAKEEAPKAVKNAPVAAPAPVDTKPAPVETKTPAPVAAGPRPGAWVVQLVALKDRAAANGIVQRLTAKGYPAFLVSPAAGAPPIYRVQVGRYNDRGEADSVKRRLEKEENYKPWIDHSR